MKKLLGILVLGLLLSGNAYAEMKVIEKKNIGDTTVKNLCIDGYRFILAQDRDGISMTQAFKEKNGKSVPSNCR